MELLLALVCDEAVATADGKLDARGIFNDLYAPGFPAKQDHLTLVVVLEWSRTDHGRFAFAVDLVDPDGQTSLSLTGHTDVDSRPSDRAPARTRLVMPIEGAVFPRPGPYRFTIRVKGRDFPGPTLQLLRAEAEPEPLSGPGPSDHAERGIAAAGESDALA